MNRSLFRAFAVASVSILGIAAAAPVHAQTVHVVDHNSPGLTKAFQNAINAAVDGDVILVKAGAFNYPPATIDGKSLTILADAGTTLQCGGLLVQNIPAGGRVVVRGMDANFLNSNVPTVNLKNNAGSLWFEDCNIQVMRFGGPPIDSVDVENCAAVTFTRCFLIPSPTGGQEQEGSGLAVKSSAVSLFDCVVVGGFGEHSSNVGFPPSPGGPGLRVESGSLFASGSTIVGGKGGLAVFVGQTGGQGGDAIHVSGSVLLRDSTLVPGPGGPSLAGPLGPPGNPSLVLPGGSLATLAVPARHFTASSPVRELATASFSFGGVPGESAAVLVSLDLAPAPPIHYFDATLVVSLGAVIDAVLFGTIPPSGTLAASFTEVALPPTVQGVNVFLQSFFFDLSVPSLVLGPGSHQVLLDASF